MYPGGHVATTAVLSGPVIQVGQRIVVDEDTGPVFIHVGGTEHDLHHVFVVLRVVNPGLVQQPVHLWNLETARLKL